MPRVKGTPNLRPWHLEQLIRAMAVGGQSDAELAAAYDIESQTVRHLRCRYRTDIAAVLQDWSNKVDHIWAARKEVRIRVLHERYQELQDLIDQLHEEARAATEEIRKDFPDAPEVLVNYKVYCAYHDRQEKILRTIADELGQLPTRSQPDTSANKPHLFHSIVGVDLNKAMGLSADSVPTPGTAPSKDEKMSELYRVMPNPAPVVDEQDPQPVVDEPAVEPVPAVSEQAHRSAQQLAQKIWAGGGRSIPQLFQGQSQSAIDELLTHATNKQWLAVNGDMVLPGLVNPTPRVTTSIPNHGW
jgi:hypothetical protein